jgi:hypothetical protein
LVFLHDFPFYVTCNLLEIESVDDAIIRFFQISNGFVDIAEDEEGFDVVWVVTEDLLNKIH